MTAAGAALSAVRLGRSFGRRRVLHQLDLELAPGAFVALYGGNGAGKTTLLRILCGLARPTAGSCRVFGQSPLGGVGQVRRRIGFLSHQGAMIPELSALENLLFYARLYGVESPAERARLLLAQVGLAGRADDRVRAFSRGMLQRLALARALVHSPDLLLLDEPFTGLDPGGVDEMAARFSELHQAGKTLLMTTHHLEQGRALADHLALLEGGRIAVFAPKSDETLAEIAERLRKKGP